ncbi:hypothetical protein [Pseudoalteromonas sp. M8]|uniref:hypothetical protein n=1 Tax=Pseudoalteromonas sp. M8 TaxID=2692624 RepID=UPI001BAAFC14|nr:hypothetical protein [Pseudoalteromonas sp. M8]QUI72447.1 hypothetical protein GSF13_23270 [Pseudoalteromonas sp. M8]
MTLREKIKQRASLLKANSNSIPKELLDKVSGGHDSHFGQGCDGDWSDSSCGFTQACKPF